MKRLLVLILFLFNFVLSTFAQEIIVQTLFKPIKKVYPDYPEILKKEGVPARFLIWINIDRKGNVVRASAGGSLYPKLEENIEKAIAQWKFEPFIHGGEPIRTFGFMKVIFYPGKLSLPVRESESMLESLEKELVVPADKELQMVLDKCAEYCLKLSESALYYICEERMREKSKKIKGSEHGLSFSPPQAYGQSFDISSASIGVLTLEGTNRHVYVYDYQLIRKEDKIEEKRIIMEKDGENVNFEKAPTETQHSYSMMPIFAPVQLLGIKQRSQFFFKRAKDEKIKRESVYVIEARPRPGQTGYIRRGRLWVNKLDFRIVKTELETDFEEGYEQIFSECNRYYLKPHFLSMHYYEVDKNNLLFPSRSEFRVEYSGFLRTKRDIKSEVKIFYSNYKFFTVETDHNIIKKKLEALYKAREKLIFKNTSRFVPYIIR